MLVEAGKVSLACCPNVMLDLSRRLFNVDEIDGSGHTFIHVGFLEDFNILRKYTNPLDDDEMSSSRRGPDEFVDEMSR
jgi:hypothetical protein